MSELHRMLDVDYDRDRLIVLLKDGADVNALDERTGEPPILVAARRRRLDAVMILQASAADLNQPGPGGKTAWAHAARRGFDEVSWFLAEKGARGDVTNADRLAIALSALDLDEARRILAENLGCARTGNPQEDRVLADMAGRNDTRPVELLIKAGADLAAPGLDGGTPLHQSAWFGQPANARLLLDAGAPLDVFDPVHGSSPLHWAIHGSTNSGGDDERQDAYLKVTRMLLEAGSRTTYPAELAGTAGSYAQRLLDDASPPVRKILVAAGVRP